MKWIEAFEIAEKYYTEHGNLLVPQGVISDGLNLYTWISKQRHRYSMSCGQTPATEKDRKNQENQMNQDGQMGQESQTDQEKQKNQNGQKDQKIQTDQENQREQGNQRNQENQGEQESQRTRKNQREQKSQRNQENQRKQENQRTHESQRNQENQEENKKSQEDQRNKKYQKDQKTSKEKPLTAAQISALESIGMVWNVNDYAWERSFAVAEAYYKEHGNLVVPMNYTRDGVNLSNWLRTQRQIRGGSLKNRKEPLTDEQIRRLDSIGMPWQPYDAVWERAFAVAQKYYREHGNLIVPKHYEEDGVNLSHWIWAQRRIVNGTKGESSRKLTEEQKRRLESIGMVWAPKSKGFSYYYGLAKRFYEEYGHTDFPEGQVTVGSEVLSESGEALAAWKREQESADFFEKNGGRAWERQRLLREIGIDSTRKLTLWDKKYRAAEEYYREHGDLLVPFSYVTEDGIHLGKWISNQRIKRRGTGGAPPTEEQIQKLDAIGMSWDETENRGKRNRHGKNTQDNGNVSAKLV